MSWLKDFLNSYAEQGLLGVGWFARDGEKEVCLNARVNGVQQPIVAVCDTPERAADIAEALNLVTRIGMNQSNVGNSPNVGNLSQLDDIGGSRRDWSKELLAQESNSGQQADGYRETEVTNIGFEDGETDSCCHGIFYRYFCPICDGHAVLTVSTFGEVRTIS